MFKYIEMASELSRIKDFLSLNDICATSTQAIVQEARSRIDNEVTTVALSLSTLRSWRNSLSHVFRLPPELLVAIFLEYMRQWHREHGIYLATGIPSWINVSYVCRNWRSVALSCAELWTHLFFVSSEWMDELLRRSKTAPLTVHVHLSFTDPEKARVALNKALGHLERIQDLLIHCSRSVATDIRAKLSASAPLLRSFHLSLSSYGYPEDQFEVSEDMFSGVMHGLRKVHLEYCQVDWGSPLFNGLTHLKLRFLRNHSEMDWHGLLLALCQLPNLRHLCLDRALPDTDNLNIAMTNTQNTVKVTFPQLEGLALAASISGVAALLAHFEFPRTTIVRLKCIGTDTRDPSILQPFIVDRFDNHLSLLPQTSALHEASFLRSLDILYPVQQEKEWKVVCGSSNYKSFVYFPIEQDLDSRFPLQFDFSERYPSSGIDRSERCIAFCRTLPVEHLNRITMNDGFPDRRCLWTEVFNNVPELHVIRLERSSPNQLIRALKPRDGRMFAPALTDIQFKEINFNRGECIDINKNHKRSAGCLWCLHNALASRAEEGNVLQRLCFDGCSGITEDRIKALSDVVCNVEWSPEVRRASTRSSIYDT